MPQPNPNFVQVQPNSNGPIVDGIALTVGSNPVYRQTSESNCPVSPQLAVLGPEVVGPNGTGTVLSCPAIPANVFGYLASMKLVSTGPCSWVIQSGSTIIGYASSAQGTDGDFTPPHRFYVSCLSTQAFSATPTNLSSSSITVYGTCMWDQC